MFSVFLSSPQNAWSANRWPPVTGPYDKLSPQQTYKHGIRYIVSNSLSSPFRSQMKYTGEDSGKGKIFIACAVVREEILIFESL